MFISAQNYFYHRFNYKLKSFLREILRKFIINSFAQKVEYEIYKFRTLLSTKRYVYTSQIMCIRQRLSIVINFREWKRSNGEVSFQTRVVNWILLGTENKGHSKSTLSGLYEDHWCRGWGKVLWKATRKRKPTKKTWNWEAMCLLVITLKSKYIQSFNQLRITWQKRLFFWPQ